MMKVNQIIEGDVLDVVRRLFERSVNCIVTSPPYFGLRDYGLPPTDWPKVVYAPMADLPEITIPPMICCLGLEDSIEAYVGHMVLVFRELWRVLRDDGVAWLNLGDSYANSAKGSIVTDNSTLSGSKTYQANGTPPNLLDKTKLGLKSKNLCGIPWRVAFALQADGWWLRSDIIWAKKDCLPESVTDRCTKAHEYVFLLAKSERYWFGQDAIREEAVNGSGGDFGSMSQKGTMRNDIGNPRGDYNQGRNKRSVWSLTSQKYKGVHFAVMPEALVEPCLLAGCPAQVCAECGEPWVRVVERKTFTDVRQAATGKAINQDEQAAARRLGERTKALRAIGRDHDNPFGNSKTIGFTPTCQCNALTRPGIVLDPFFGSGTVGAVAKKLKRDFLGIELNPDYIKLAEERIAQVQPPLFAQDGMMEAVAAVVPAPAHAAEQGRLFENE